MHEKLLCVDPGSENSGWVEMRGRELLACGVCDNTALAKRIYDANFDRLCIESIEYLNPKSGKTTIQTIEWIGGLRMVAAMQGRKWTKVPRKMVLKILMGTTKVKDADVCAYIRSIYPATGGGKWPSVGTSKHPGPLFGLTSHAWQAMAVGLTYQVVFEGAIYPRADGQSELF